MSNQPVLSLENVEVHFENQRGFLGFGEEDETVRAVDGVTIDIEERDVVSLIDVPTLLRGEQHELGSEARDVAFALYGDRRAAMNTEHITTYDPSRSEPYSTRTLDGSPVADDDDLIASIEEFDIEGGITRYDADEETLRELGYLE